MPPELIAGEAALLRARAATETARAATETARAAAETTRAAADAFATRAFATRAVAIARAEGARAATATVVDGTFALGAMMALALAVDFYVHESPQHIQRRMLRVMRACRPPPSSSAARPTQLLRALREPLCPMLLPTMVLGPTGCGKSTLLEELAQSLLSAPVPTPVTLVRLRLPASVRRAGAGAPPAAAAAALMDSAAAQVFEQIGFPARRSLIGLLAHGFVRAGAGSQADAGLSASGRRLLTALQLLFAAGAQVQAKGIAAGKSATAAAPVFLFDEVQDLIKDERLRLAGGDIVFDTLGTLLVAYGVDRKAVRCVVAGSSAGLDFAFSASSPARGNRWRYCELGDPAPADVEAALRARGYSAGEAHAMTELCGSRLRLLEAPLTEGAARVGAADFLHATMASGCAAFASVFAALDGADGARLARVLDTLLELDRVASGASAAPAAGAVRPPTREALPAAALRAAGFSSILYVDRLRELAFQSRLHARAWPLMREAYSAPRPLPER